MLENGLKIKNNQDKSTEKSVLFFVILHKIKEHALRIT